MRGDRLLVSGSVQDQGRVAVERLLAVGVCRSVCYFDSVESTNSLALSDLQSLKTGADDCPLLYLADQQTAGRGRHGKRWESSEGSLTFSLVVGRPSGKREMDLLPIAVGVGLARSLDRQFPTIRSELKWPNDVYCGGGKTAGILLETSPPATDCVVIGIGVNVGRMPDLSADVTANPVCSVSQAAGRPVNRYECFESIVESVIEATAVVAHNPRMIIKAFRSRCLLTGNRVTYQMSGREQEGMCRGINDDGELVVESNGRATRVRSGEARLVRAQE